MNFIKSNSFFYYSLAFIAIVLLIVCFTFEGTGGGGDSVFHFQYAKFAGQHPENFFNHWAKPLFTIFAYPFAQFGFIGIKIFNLLLSVITCYFTFQILKCLKMPNAHFVALILFSITLFVNVTLSGLTEPLSACILMLSIFLLFKNKNLLGISIISFLPFVRSEGLIILGVFLIYLILSKKYKLIPMLSIGHIIMSILGSFYYHDLLWVFTKIPYASFSHTYGVGNWTHFVEQLFFQMGLIEYVLLILGCLTMLVVLLKSKNDFLFFKEKLWLIYGCFFAFFIAHTCFWALGIFNSIGLTRVFVSVMPLAAIIILDGLNFIEKILLKFNTLLSLSVKYILLFLIVVFPFLGTPSSYNLPEAFELEASQELIKNKVVPFLNKHQPNKTVVIADISIPFFKNEDPFDKSKIKMMYDIKNFNELDSNTIVVWDTWLSVLDFGLTKEYFLNCKSLKMDTIFYIKSKKGRETEYAVFSKK